MFYSGTTLTMRFLSARLISFLFTLCCMWQLHAQPLELQRRAQVNAPHVQFSEAAQRWLDNHSTLNVGVWGQEQPPLSEGMGHGVFGGIAADYLALLEDSLKVKLSCITTNTVVRHYWHCSVRKFRWWQSGIRRCGQARICKLHHRGYWIKRF
jgi:hypothetical protein